MGSRLSCVRRNGFLKRRMTRPKYVWYLFFFLPKRCSLFPSITQWLSRSIKKNIKNSPSWLPAHISYGSPFPPRRISPALGPVHKSIKILVADGANVAGFQPIY